jgi:hypothetical protein
MKSCKRLVVAAAIKGLMDGLYSGGADFCMAKDVHINDPISLSEGGGTAVQTTSKNYSYLSAIIGSTRIARRAGI